MSRCDEQAGYGLTARSVFLTLLAKLPGDGLWPGRCWRVWGDVQAQISNLEEEPRCWCVSWVWPVRAAALLSVSAGVKRGLSIEGTAHRAAQEGEWRCHKVLLEPVGMGEAGEWGFLLMDSTLAISEMGFVPLDLIEFLVLYWQDRSMATVACSFLASVLLSFPCSIWWKSKGILEKQITHKDLYHLSVMVWLSSVFILTLEILLSNLLCYLWFKFKNEKIMLDPIGTVNVHTYCSNCTLRPGQSSPIPFQSTSNNYLMFLCLCNRSLKASFL